MSVKEHYQWPLADKTLGAHVKIPVPSKSNHLSLPVLPGARVISHVSWVSKWRSGKESACHCRRLRRHGVYPWVGKIPWSRKWQPTPVCLPGKFHAQRGLAGYSAGGLKEPDSTEYACTMSLRTCTMSLRTCAMSLRTVSEEGLQMITKWKHTVLKSSANI